MNMAVAETVMMAVVVTVMVMIVVVVIIMGMAVGGRSGIVMVVVVRSAILRVTVIGLHDDSLTVEFLG